MDWNEYFAEWLVHERLAEARAPAKRARLVDGRPRRPRAAFRVTVGTALIRLGAWLLREEYQVMSR